MCAEARRQRADRFRTLELKQESRARLRAAGFQTARTLAVCHRDDLVAEIVKHERCVAKPTTGAGAIGVMALQRSGKVWRELLRGKRYDVGSINSMTEAIAEQYPSWADTWIVEEMLIGPDGKQVADEFQVHIFGEVVPFVRQRRAGPPLAYRYWSPDGACMTDDLGKTDLPMSKTMSRPADLGPFVAEALKVSAEFNEANFVRVDVYDTNRGPRIGEVNGWVGTPQYTPEWDRRLGQLWLDAGGV